MTPEGEKLGILPTILAGGSAGIANWIVGVPPDVLKSRLQSGKKHSKHITIYYSTFTLFNNRA